MPIQVTCPSCLSRFNVSDKFAGQTGPCPKCKKPIKIPEKTEQVVIHAPRDDSPKDSKGRSVLKPIRRQETRITRLGIVVTASTVVFLLAGAVAVRLLSTSPHVLLVILGTIVVAPPAIFAAYAFSRDSELEPLVGSDLRNRVLILSGIFAALWLIYAYVPMYVFELDSPSQMSLFIAGVMLVIILLIGAFAAFNALELEFSGGVTVAGMYIVSCLVLALIAGIPISSMEMRRQPRERELLLEPQAVLYRSPRFADTICSEVLD